MVTERELQEDFETALDSVICFCGNYKRMAQLFCFQCYDSLPTAWQGQVYAATITYDTKALSQQYDAAREWLRRSHSARFPSLDSAQLS